MIASDIEHHIKIDIAYPVKHIMAHVKNTWNVDISYDKAWNSRRIAIERIFGTWESNFAELPKYIDELQHTNPGTIVRWSHHPTGSRQQPVMFKYIFWAFRPAIEAFNLCIPVVCIDGTHLRGNYRGKLLAAVTKNANGNILPVAYAIVDEESNESWSWFLHNFREHVASLSNRKLCVISDRHMGIINAMEDMPDWHHRFCLRHVCSNVMKKFSNRKAKRLCWALGSTTQRRKYAGTLRALRREGENIWEYLNEIGLDKWTLLHDVKYRRWGNLTTNIAESMNNVIKEARMMPIKALIEYTFRKANSHFVGHYTDASRWTSPLARNMWRLYGTREQNSRSHTVQLYSAESVTYNVVSSSEQNDFGGNDYTVEFNDQKCSCGKWQIQRFACSHAIAVGGHLNLNGQRNLDAKSLVSKKYTTRTWKAQYSSTFAPLRHKDYWSQPTWSIVADSARLLTHRGRRRNRRIPNEMDQSQGRRPKRCNICNGTGHNSRTCTNR